MPRKDGTDGSGRGKGNKPGPGIGKKKGGKKGKCK